MALLDIFKKIKKRLRKKKKEEKKIVLPADRQEKKEAKKEKEFLKIPKVEKEIKIKPPRTKKGIPEMAYRILSFPNITEKATFLTKENKYIFRVYPDANKTEIKKVIGDMYGVDVVDVKIINIPAKKRRFKKQIGWRKGYKKAVIEIKEGQKIEVLPR